jgi:hypothetical protein
LDGAFDAHVENRGVDAVTATDHEGLGVHGVEGDAGGGRSGGAGGEGLEGLERFGGLGTVDGAVVEAEGTDEFGVGSEEIGEGGLRHERLLWGVVSHEPRIDVIRGTSDGKRERTTLPVKGGRPRRRG